MRTVIILIATIFLTFLSYSQNLEVDKRNGFKDIKLGSDPMSFGEIEELPTDDPNRTRAYWRTQDKELGYFFNNKIDFFELTFDKNEGLISIQIVIVIKKPYTDSSVSKKFKSIANKLVIALGNPSKVKVDSMELLWFGNKVGMSLKIESESLYYDDNGEIKGLTSLKFYVVSYDRVEKEKEIKKGF